MKIAAYGTLRGGLHSARYLTHKYGQDAVKELGTHRLKGFDLYTAPMFGVDCPFVYKGEGTITVTLLEISEPDASADIDRGESWAYDKVKIKIDGVKGDVFMYQAKKERTKNFKLVTTGDYLKRDKQK
jgi:gamma-glutamylcyclotransferase (GGCT)/AIG2-like uncharacterized protein YtfP